MMAWYAEPATGQGGAWRMLRGGGRRAHCHWNYWTMLTTVGGKEMALNNVLQKRGINLEIDNPSGIAENRRKKVLVEAFWIHQNKCCGTPGADQNFKTKICLFFYHKPKLQ
jgi:hypothetical protein